jgi:AcrR family transcriptional regulator
MANTKKQQWIEIGYSLFAEQGPKGLKVETLARAVGKSKSSFYHYFADLEVFIQELFEYHLERAKIIYEVAKACQQMDPDFLDLILTYKEDVFFHRQLRIHRELPNYNRYIEKVHHPIEEAFLEIWGAALMLEDKLFLAQAFLSLVVDNFYMRIHEENLNPEWLRAYLKEITNMVRGIQKQNRQ